MSNTPQQQRSMRSNSNTKTNITLTEIKTLIQNQTAEIVNSLTREIKDLKQTIDALVKRVDIVDGRVDKLEERNACLEKRCHQLEKKSNQSAMSFLDEMEDRLRRRKCLVISGVPEQTEGTVHSRSEADKQKVQVMLQDLCGISEPRISRIHRIGSQQQDKARLIRLVLENENDAKNILQKAKQLRDSPQYDRIFINPDLTPFQREIYKKLREELKRRRNSAEDVVIRGGKIVPRIRSQNFQ